MPRDGSGQYTLPAGNPVITNTVISSTWANATMTDVASQLNNVYTRDGLLGPTGPFKLADGSVNAPGLTFNSEPTLGLYRISQYKVGWSASSGTVITHEADNPANMIVTEYPLTTGQSTLKLFQAPFGSVNNEGFSLSTGDTNKVESLAIGTGVKPDIEVIAPNVIIRGNVTFPDSPGGTGYLPLIGGTLTGNLNVITNNYSTLLVKTTTAPVDKRNGYFQMGNDGSLNVGGVNDAGNAFTRGIVIRSDNVVYDLPSGGKFWHQNNDGQGSGLDADVLRGLVPDWANTPNTLVWRIGGNSEIRVGPVTAPYLGGGAGSAGNLRTYGNTNSLNFRWDGSIYARIDETTEVRLVTGGEAYSGFGVGSGWARMPSGFIMQWLRSTISDDGWAGYTLPITFPSNIGNVVASPGPGSAIVGNSVIACHCAVASSSQVSIGLCANFSISNCQFSALITGW
jgi:hypothetical protein